MSNEADKILDILDRCCNSFTFPMLDNGYVYLAATRLSLYRANADWAMVIETFGFSPRSGCPDTCIYTFANVLCNRNVPESSGKGELYENYLRNNPNNEMRFIQPLDCDEWQKVPDSEEAISENTKEFVLRG